MVQAPFCANCISGHLHEGTPGGSVRDFAGTATYFAPAPQTPSKATIVLLTDVFGYALPNVRLVADEYSRAGFNAIVPDIFHGDNVGHDALNNIKSRDEMFALLTPWFANHGTETVTSVLDPIFDKLKSDGQTVGAVGYCFGGKYSFHYAASDKIAAACALHPSRIEVSEDAPGVKKPLSVHVAASDDLYDTVKSREVAKILESNKVPYENRIYDGEGVVHGFGVRADLSKPAAKKTKEESFAATVAWFQKFL